MRFLRVAALVALAAVVVQPAAGSTSVAGRAVATFTPSAGHRLAGFALDQESLGLAEDPAAVGACPAVSFVTATGGVPRTITRPRGVTCTFGGRFWVRPGVRALGVALEKALWVVRNGSRAIAVKGSSFEPEVVLARVSGIQAARGPFLGPVVAKEWLRLFGSYVRESDGTLSGGVVSGNQRTLWQATGPVLPLGLDIREHAVSVGADGGIAMWHAHGARYGRVPDAHARAASLTDGLVVILRSDRNRIDIRNLAGRVLHSWPVDPGAAPLIDADSGAAVYFTGRTVHELQLGNGRDTVIATAPAGSKLIDAQIEESLVAYAYTGGDAPRGRLVVLRR